jgi:hypothetical protein
MLGNEFIALLFSIFRRFAYDLDTARCVHHWHTSFRKFETVDPIEAPFSGSLFGFITRPCLTAA